MLVRLAACGVCHTDLYTASGADPTGYAPCVLGHEGAGRRRARRRRRHARSRPGDHVITLFAPECGECVHCRSPKTNRCVAIRDQQNAGYLPDGTTRLSATASRSGTSWAPRPSPSTRSCPRSRSRGSSPEAPLEGCAPFACGLSTGIGAALYTAKVEPGSTVAVFGCGLVGLGAVIGRASPAPSGSSPSTSPRSASRRRATTARPTRGGRATTPSTGSARRRAASAPTTPSRRPATSP